MKLLIQGIDVNKAIPFTNEIFSFPNLNQSIDIFRVHSSIIKRNTAIISNHENALDQITHCLALLDPAHTQKNFPKLEICWHLIDPRELEQTEKTQKTDTLSTFSSNKIGVFLRSLE